MGIYQILCHRQKVCKQLNYLTLLISYFSHQALVLFSLVRLDYIYIHTLCIQAAKTLVKSFVSCQYDNANIWLQYVKIYLTIKKPDTFCLLNYETLENIVGENIFIKYTMKNMTSQNQKYRFHHLCPWSNCLNIYKKILFMYERQIQIQT